MSFLKKFIPKEAAEASALEYITAGGFRFDQMEGIPDSEEDILKQSPKFNRAVLPHYDTRNKPDNKKTLDRFLQNYEAYQFMQRVKARIEARIENGGSARDKHLLKMVNNAIEVTKELEVSEGKHIIGDTYKPLTDKTIVLNKPYILTHGSQSSFWDSTGGKKSGEELEAWARKT